MVLQKRLYYGFNGYQVPTMPQGSRSARGKRSARKKVEESQMCAFELLATVAGKLLLEKDNSLTPSNIAGDIKPTIAKKIIKKEQQEEVKPSKVVLGDQGSCDEGASVPKIGFHRHAKNYTLKECSSSAVGLGLASIVVKSDTSEKSFAEESIIKQSKGECGHSPGPVDLKFSAERHSPGSAESYGGKAEDRISTPLQVEWQRVKNGLHGNGADPHFLEHHTELDTKPPALVSSDSSVDVLVCGDHIPHSTFSNCQNDMELTIDRDDDENHSGYTQHCTLGSKAYRPQRIGDRRIRKLLASKFWKVGPTLLKNAEFTNTDEHLKHIFHSRKMRYTRQRTQRCYFKRRKLFERGSILTSDGTVSSAGISWSPEKGMKGDGNCSAAHGQNGILSSITGQKSAFQSEDYHVKLSIKSFKVPELFIEIPETATVGSLKRTVVEAVTAILGGGLRVGVLLQGKKVRDDNKTLLQAGISHNDKPDSLGFTLEPNPSQAPQQLTNLEDARLLPPCDTTQPLTRFPASPTLDPVAAEAPPDHPPLIMSGNFAESDHDSVPTSTDITMAENTTPNLKALIPVQPMDVEALAVVPLHQKSRCSELVQRRIRRPFSVSEVEALVQAVENLGTGRWRDVKLCSFDNANHRTYVDLKDKWKTLVHTARISPQQRRGEPLPQELLDRVLSAHGYWSQQQAKIQVKPRSRNCKATHASPSDPPSPFLY